MNRYYYCVNTDRNDEPIQVSGCIYAENEDDAIQKLIDNGTVSPNFYEFLDLMEEDVHNFLNEVRDIQRKYGIYIGAYYDKDWNCPCVRLVDKTYNNTIFKVYEGLFYD